MKNKGFTLIELIVTIVIMALILILVIPSIVSLVNNNEKRKFEYYNNILIEAAKIYVNKEKEDITSLGTNNWTGCVDITYQDLIDSDLIKPFTEENIDCSNSKVRFTKTRKKESYSVNLTCKNLSENKVIYNQINIPNANCTTTAY